MDSQPAVTTSHTICDPTFNFEKVLQASTELFSSTIVSLSHTPFEIVYSRHYTPRIKECPKCAPELKALSSGRE